MWCSMFYLFAEESRKYRLIKEQCGMVSPEMLSPDSIPSLTSEGDSPYHSSLKVFIGGVIFLMNSC